MKIVALVGLSGVGKSTLLSQIALKTDFLHLQASALIKDELKYSQGQIASSEDLRLGMVLDNQALLINGFRRATNNFQGLVVFDGHIIIDGANGIVEIPATVFGSLGIQHLIFLKDEPAVILNRRANDKRRSRPLRSVPEIMDHQNRAIKTAQKISDDLSIPLSIIRPEQIVLLESFLQIEG